MIPKDFNLEEYIILKIKEIYDKGYADGFSLAASKACPVKPILNEFIFLAQNLIADSRIDDNKKAADDRNYFIKLLHEYHIRR